MTKSLKTLLTQILSKLYIYGSDGYWTYKKYMDGSFDMWRRYSGAPTTGSHYITMNGFYGYYISGLSFPAACKPKSVNDYSVHAEWQIGSGFAMSATAISRTANGFNIYALSTAANQTSVTANVYVHGLWK